MAIEEKAIFLNVLKVLKEIISLNKIRVKLKLRIELFTLLMRFTPKEYSLCIFNMRFSCRVGKLLSIF